MRLLPIDMRYPTVVRRVVSEPRAWLFALAFALVCGTTAFPAPPARPQGRDRLFQEARQYQEKGDWRQAEACYLRFLREVPDSAAGHSNLGIVYVHEGEFKDAMREYRDALKLDSSLSGVYLNLGILYYHERDYRAAAPVLEKFLSANPGNRQAEELLGLCDLELDNYEDAVTMLKPLRDGAGADLLIALSAAYVRLRRMPEAEALLRQLLGSANADSAQVHFLMGQTYAGLHNFPQALEEFDTVEDLDGTWPNIRLLVGATEARLGHYSAAEGNLRAQLQKTPGNHETLFTLGALLNKEGRYKEAKPLLTRARAIGAQNAAVTFEWAKACWKTGSLDDAWNAIQKAIRMDPKNGPAHYLYAEMARQRGDGTTAQQEFAAAESLSTKMSEDDILRLSEASQGR